MLTFSEVPWLPFFLCQKMIFLWKFRGTPRTLFSCNDWSVETTWILGQTAWSLQINYIKAWEIWTSFTGAFRFVQYQWLTSHCQLTLSKTSLVSWNSGGSCWDVTLSRSIPTPPLQIPTTLPSPQIRGAEVSTWEKNLNWLANGSLKRKCIISQLQQVTRCQCSWVLQHILKPAGVEKIEYINRSKMLPPCRCKDSSMGNH